MDLNQLEQQTGIGIAVAVALGLLLLASKPKDRAGIRNMLVIAALMGATLLAGAALQRWGSVRGGALLSALATAGTGAVIIRLTTMLLFRVILPRLALETVRIVEDLCVTALALAWILYFLSGIGLDLKSLLATSAVITAVLAFSMQDTLGNILGGVVLQLDDSVRVGDWVVIDGVGGQVVDVRWRHTAVETRNRETVIIPNGWLVKNRFLVIGSRQDARTRWRRWVWFNLELEANPGRVLQVLEDSVRDSEAQNVLLDPAPSAVLMDVNQGYARYALRYWVADPRPDDPTDSDVRRHALAALARNGMRLAVLQEERLVIKENERRRAALQADELERRLRLLGEVDLFSHFALEELQAIAEKLTRAEYVRGATVTRQGRVAHWLYLIVSGEADVWVEQNGKRTHVATLLPGSVVGEMGMMTGEPRRATVTARSDLECLRLGKSGFESVLRARPDIAHEISAVIGARQHELDRARENAGVVAEEDRPEAIGARIRAFFGLEA
ncbi:MAG: mechanosensitive ion channel [Xanthomonadales bacterium]|nr:mechanosensitive ion channel [Xanthomonadales bacterium]MCE7931834.1 mechanosensitive ion channel protein MscS [Xanthomonadales bacterium PRO6]